MIVSGFLSYYAVLGSIGVIAAVLLGLRRALVDAGWPARERSQSILLHLASLAKLRQAHRQGAHPTHVHPARA